MLNILIFALSADISEKINVSKRYDKSNSPKTKKRFRVNRNAGLL